MRSLPVLLATPETMALHEAKAAAPQQDLPIGAVM
jgi:hypothetical protein